MAIQVRRGLFGRYDPTRLVAGEWAVVLGDDPSCNDGRAVYICFGANIVKRVAMYEDMLDWFADLKEDTIDKVIYDAMAGIREEYELIKDETLDAEAARVLAEALREVAEDARVQAENQRATAEALRDEAESKRQDLANDLEQKRSSGYWDGATYTPFVDKNGVLQWTNDQDKPNPESVNIRGPKGADGVIVTLETGAYGFEVREDGHLYLIYTEGTKVPDFYIEDGHLLVNIEG